MAVNDCWTTGGKGELEGLLEGEALLPHLELNLLLEMLESLPCSRLREVLNLLGSALELVLVPLLRGSDAWSEVADG